MKRVFCILAVVGLLLGGSQSASAQKSGELLVKGGVGYLTLYDLLGSLVVGLGTISGDKESNSESFVPMLNPNLSVYWGVTDKMAVGASLSFGYSSGRVVTETGAVSRSMKVLYPSLCFDVYTTYYRSGKFSFYGMYGAGPMLYMSEQTDEGVTTREYKLLPTAQMYPIGFSYGGKISGFIEGGWGAKGLVNAGISCCF
jgi:hypothetical protein